MLRMFAEVTIPKNYITNCKFIEYMQLGDTENNYGSILETEEPSMKTYSFAKVGNFTRLFDAIQDCHSFDMKLIYTQIKQGHSSYIEIYKDNDRLNIILIDPTGIAHSTAFIEPIMKNILIALRNTNQAATLYVSNVQLQRATTGCEYFTQYLLKYFTQYPLSDALSQIKINNENLIVCDNVNVIIDNFLPKNLLLLTQSVKTINKLFNDDDTVNTLLDFISIPFSTFKGNYLHQNHEGTLTNQFVQHFKWHVNRLIQDIHIANPLKYNIDAINTLINKINDTVRYEAAM